MVISHVMKQICITFKSTMYWKQISKTKVCSNSYKNKTNRTDTHSVILVKASNKDSPYIRIFKDMMFSSTFKDLTSRSACVGVPVVIHSSVKWYRWGHMPKYNYSLSFKKQINFIFYTCFIVYYWKLIRYHCVRNQLMFLVVFP